MPTCKKCGSTFANAMWIDGKKHVVNSRKYCLECSPFGQHNTRKIHLLSDEERKAVGSDTPVEVVCKYCGRSYLYGRNKGGQASKTACNSCYANLRRYGRKIEAIRYKGEKCIRCGYDGMQCPGAMDFHHRDPGEKDFNIGGTHALSWDKVRAELDKCDLVCCRCHREIEWEQGREKRERYAALGFNMENTNRRVVSVHHKVCQRCGSDFEATRARRKYCSDECAGQNRRKVVRPLRSELGEMIKEMSLREIGRKFGVSDKAVGKWLRAEGLPVTLADRKKWAVETK